MGDRVIRTPDQRLRVFVSSTLGELAEERSAVRQAIESLRLAPVLFELGARPHPPRELYRSYLDQSHVFVGIYWQRYGWIAPGEEVSGLEDEYRLAGARPRLLYIKEPAPDRDDRLDALIAAFADDDLASYKRFATASELAALVADDLAVLLSERFEGAATPPARARWRTPAAATPILGRRHELGRIGQLLGSGARLVTLTGIGGIGKTRLAVEAATAFEPEAVFVGLAHVTDADRALRTIAEATGTADDPSRRIEDLVAEHLRAAPVPLVLDNLEQIPDLAPAIARLLEAVPGLRVLATSRRALRIRAEHEVTVPPLALPPPGWTADRLGEQPAVELFLDRAGAIGATLDEEPATLAQVAEICRRLEGIPLAIELAAARTRLLGPEELLGRLEHQLDALVGGAPDAPERQRTLRATIDWSHALLDDAQRTLLARLSVFSGGWTLDAAEAVCGPGGLEGGGVVDGLAGLLDSSLVTPSPPAGGAPRWTMFETVRAYAAEQLEAGGETARLLERHLGHVRQIGARAQPFLCGPGQRSWVERLDPERPNLRRAVTTALGSGRWVDAVELAWDVIVLYFVRDAVDEPAGWLDLVAASTPALDEVTAAKLRSLHALTRVHRGDYDGVHADLAEPLALFRREGMTFEAAVALHQLGFVRYHVDRDVDAAVAALRESSSAFDSLGHDWGVALAEAMLGSVFAAEGDTASAEACQQRALDRARRIDNEPLVVQALQQLAFIRILDQREPEALALLEESAALVTANRLRTDAAYCLDALALLALTLDEDDLAAGAVAVAARERARLGVTPWPSLAGSIERVRGAARRRVGPDRFDQLWRDAGERDVFDAVSDALAGVRRRAAT